MAKSPERLAIMSDAKASVANALGEALKASGMSKSELARRSGTSRSQLDRVLDPHKSNVRIVSLVRVALALGKSIAIDIE